MGDENTWRRCNACKEPIAHGVLYWVCSVSTCNRKRTGLAFCTVSCWDAHLPTANHREAWAEERTAPTRAEAEAEAADPGTGRTGKRRIVSSPTPARSDAPADEILIVASRLKDYVRSRSGYNTSERVLRPLSEIVRRACDEAIRRARAEGRRTLLDRDFPD